jgi:hypothetical protein
MAGGPCGFRRAPIVLVRAPIALVLVRGRSAHDTQERDPEDGQRFSTDA